MMSFIGRRSVRSEDIPAQSEEKKNDEGQFQIIESEEKKSNEVMTDDMAPVIERIKDEKKLNKRLISIFRQMDMLDSKINDLDIRLRWFKRSDYKNMSKEFVDARISEFRQLCYQFSMRCQLIVSGVDEFPSDQVELNFKRTLKNGKHEKFDWI